MLFHVSHRKQNSIGFTWSIIDTYWSPWKAIEYLLMCKRMSKIPNDYGIIVCCDHGCSVYTCGIKGCDKENLMLLRDNKLTVVKHILPRNEGWAGYTTSIAFLT